MTEVPEPDGERNERPKGRFARMRTVVWSWLTDPAVLLYRREAHGRHKLRVLTVEFFLFVREVASELYKIEGTNRAASLAYTTLLIASCLENVDIYPVIFLLKDHAFPGYWRNEEARDDFMAAKSLPVDVETEQSNMTTVAGSQISPRMNRRRGSRATSARFSSLPA